MARNQTKNQENQLNYSKVVTILITLGLIFFIIFPGCILPTYKQTNRLVKYPKDQIRFITKSSIGLIVAAIIVELLYLQTCLGMQCLGTLYLPLIAVGIIIFNIIIQFIIIKTR